MSGAALGNDARNCTAESAVAESGDSPWHNGTEAVRAADTVSVPLDSVGVRGTEVGRVGDCPATGLIAMTATVIATPVRTTRIEIAPCFIQCPPVFSRAPTDALNPIGLDRLPCHSGLAKWSSNIQQEEGQTRRIERPVRPSADSHGLAEWTYRPCTRCRCQARRQGELAVPSLGVRSKTQPPPGFWIQ
jgi:hypothetical protein